MIEYDNNFILQTLVAWINDITISKLHKHYRFAGDDLESELGEPSKSYLNGQFYIDKKTNTLYIYYLLDPNIRWGKPDVTEDMYKTINDYILKESKHSLLRDLRIEFLNDEESYTEKHESGSTKCRSEATNRELYDDTISIWKNKDGEYRFIRDSSILEQDKSRVYKETGKKDFSDYRAEVKLINDNYSYRTDNDSIRTAFYTYKAVYESYFGREIDEVDENDITRFYLLNWTDYSIKEKKVYNENM